MKKIVLFWVFTGCMLTLSQCNKVENSDNGISPIETWDYSKVAFIARVSLSDNSAPWFLFTVDKAGNSMRQIVEMTTTCSKPVRSHSGDKLLFSSLTSDNLHELYVVNTDGSNLALIDRADVYCGNADWSPDDEYIAYVRCSDPYWNNSDLICYNMSDKTYTILQNQGSISCPNFFPNGKQIAYCKPDESGSNIYKMDIDGNNNQLIISDASCPKCSPQGDKIIYISPGIDRSSQIFVANVDGSGRKQLTSSVSSGWWDTGFPRDGNEDPHWTPDGKKIVYVSWENAKSEIFIMDVDGNNKKRLTTAELRDESPNITPDGRYILFSSRGSDMIDGGVCIMTLDGNNRKVVFKGGIYPIVCK